MRDFAFELLSSLDDMFLEAASDPFDVLGLLHFLHDPLRDFLGLALPRPEHPLEGCIQNQSKDASGEDLPDEILEGSVA